jgi:hypothetical protein
MHPTTCHPTTVRKQAWRKGGAWRQHALGLCTAIVVGLALSACNKNPNPEDLANNKGGIAAPGSPRDFAVNAGDLVYFSTDNVELSPEATQTVSNQARWLKQYAQYTITIEGPASTTSRWGPSVPRRCVISWSATASMPPASARFPTARSAPWRCATTSPAGRRTGGRRPCSTAGTRPSPRALLRLRHVSLSGACCTRCNSRRPSLSTASRRWRSPPCWRGTGRGR